MFENVLFSSMHFLTFSFTYMAVGLVLSFPSSVVFVLFLLSFPSRLSVLSPHSLFPFLELFFKHNKHIYFLLLFSVLLKLFILRLFSSFSFALVYFTIWFPLSCFIFLSTSTCVCKSVCEWLCGSLVRTLNVKINQSHLKKKIFFLMK